MANENCVQGFKAAAEDAIQQIKNHCPAKKFSDIVDKAGHQYVDLVMEGGGVLGIALTGYTYALEQAGIRFIGVGGTSAGSINALLIAALGKDLTEAKSEKLVELLAAMPMASFIDGDQDARDFSEAVIGKSRMSRLLFKAFQVMDNLKEDLGLNPGQKFLGWLKRVLLEEAGIGAYADIKNKLRVPQGALMLRQGVSPDKRSLPEAVRLAIVAADITTETKVEFPKMAKLYWGDPDQVNPACFVRASMSIPFFFHPFRVNVCSQDSKLWEKFACYRGHLPQSVIFMDGGIMSNFPIDLFHQPECVPRAPTFGVKIGTDRIQPKAISKPSELASAVFDAAKHTLDFDFINKNPDYERLVAKIDTGEHHWLNFSMSDSERHDLFRRGAETAAKFLCEFDWEQYKNIREGIQKAKEASQPKKGAAAFKPKPDEAKAA